MKKRIYIMLITVFSIFLFFFEENKNFQLNILGFNIRIAPVFFMFLLFTTNFKISLIFSLVYFIFVDVLSSSIFGLNMVSFIFSLLIVNIIKNNVYINLMNNFLLLGILRIFIIMLILHTVGLLVNSIIYNQINLLFYIKYFFIEFLFFVSVFIILKKPIQDIEESLKDEFLTSNILTRYYN